HWPQPSLVSLDPPAHTRLRLPTAKAFTPGRVNSLAPLIESTLKTLLEAIGVEPIFDLVAALAQPLPLTVIFALIGVPSRDMAQVKEWCSQRAVLAWG